MARYTSKDVAQLYRAVVTTRKGAASQDSFYGPYDSRRTAASVGGHMVAEKRRWGLDAAYVVEETQTQWYQVDD